MPETITTRRGGTGFLGRIIDSKNDAVEKSTYDYRNALTIGIDDGAGGETIIHVIFSNGSLRRANFAASGVYYAAPLRSIIFHVGTRNFAGTAAGLVIQRISIANGDYQDWQTADGVALGTLLTN